MADKILVSLSYSDYGEIFVELATCVGMVFGGCICMETAWIQEHKVSWEAYNFDKLD